MKIAIATDHRGVDLKQQILDYLISKGYEVLDYSKHNEPTDDYPDFAYLVCQSIINKESDLGILVCRSGIGMSIAANKVKGIYCGRIVSTLDASLARIDNGVNVITLDSTEDMTIDKVTEIIDTFINTPPLGDERHERRFNKIIKIENGEYDKL